jgi:general secretion pathway protein M
MKLGDPALVSRASALLVLAGLIGIVWLGPVNLYLDMLRGNAEDVAVKERTLERYRELLRSPAQKDRPAGSDAEVLILADLSESQAIAALQERLNSTAAATRVVVQGLQVLPPEPFSGSVKVGVRLRATTDIGGLNRLLYDIENARPALYADNLQINGHAQRGSDPSAALDVQIDVFAFKTGPAT